MTRNEARDNFVELLKKEVPDPNRWLPIVLAAVEYASTAAQEAVEGFSAELKRQELSKKLMERLR